MTDEIDKKISALPPEWGLIIQNHLEKVYENGRRFGVEQSLKVLKDLHGSALAKHNYYAHAAIEVRKLKSNNCSVK